MWIETAVPASRSPKEQLSTPVLMAHGSPAGCWSIVQARPPLLGSGSVSVTPWAAPSPLLVTLVMAIAAQFTVTESDASPEPSLLVVTDAVLSTRPQVSAVVGLEIWTVRLAP